MIRFHVFDKHYDVNLYKFTENEIDFFKDCLRNIHWDFKELIKPSFYEIPKKELATLEEKYKNLIDFKKRSSLQNLLISMTVHGELPTC